MTMGMAFNLGLTVWAVIKHYDAPSLGKGSLPDGSQGGTTAGAKALAVAQVTEGFNHLGFSFRKKLNPLLLQRRRTLLANFFCSQNLTFSRWAGEFFHQKPYRLHGTTYTALSGIGHQNAIRF